MILILDFGSQYTQLIARRIRQMGFYAAIYPYHESIEDILAHEPKGIILSGGPSSVGTDTSPTPDQKILDLDIPILGICYGLQVMVQLNGGDVIPADHREYGRAQLSINGHQNPLFEGLPASSTIWMSHGDKVTRIPDGFEVTGESENSEFCAIAHNERPWFGLQFHPEVQHTEFGNQILENFAEKICRSERNWNMEDFIEREIRIIRERVGDHKVICGLSGGVDSTVLAVLLHKALGDQLRCIFVDNGLLRWKEAEIVKKRMNEHAGIDVEVVDAADKFLDELEGVSDPEEKRKIIGRIFIETFFPEMGPQDFLAQGTLYPDVIESVNVKGPSDTIKTHHNRVQEVLDLMKEGRVIEPLQDLFKDEVRELGLELGLPEEIVHRHPFPGPGLAIRIMSDVDREKVELLQKADLIIVQEAKSAGLYRDIWQIFGVLLPVKSVGVMGDSRTYANALAIRAVTSKDAMTADWAHLPYEFLGKVSNRIVNEIEGINRVVYDITSKPPGTIEWE